MNLIDGKAVSASVEPVKAEKEIPDNVEAAK